MYECAACGFSFDLAAAESVGPAIVERAEGVVLALRSTPAAQVRTRPIPRPGRRSNTAAICATCCSSSVSACCWPAAPTVPSPNRWDATSESSTTGTPRRIPLRSPDSSPTRRRCSRTCSRGSRPADWARVLVYNYPERMERDLRWVAVHTLHEVVHHGADIDAQLAT